MHIRRNYLYPPVILLIILLTTQKAWVADLEGQTWIENGLISGRTIKFFDAGQYDSEQWSDLESLGNGGGTWERSGYLIILTPLNQAEGIQSYKLLEITKEGCTVLVPPERLEGPQDFNPYFAYMKKGDTCLYKVWPIQ